MKGMLPTPVFWPGEFYEQRILAGYSPWGRKESDRLSDFQKKKAYSHILY